MPLDVGGLGALLFYDHGESETHTTSSSDVLHHGQQVAFCCWRPYNSVQISLRSSRIIKVNSAAAAAVTLSARVALIVVTKIRVIINQPSSVRISPKKKTVFLQNFTILTHSAQLAKPLIAHNYSRVRSDRGIPVTH